MTKEEAIRRIKSWNLDSDDMEVLSVIIPELYESEDEKIRKSLVDYFSCFKPTDMWNNLFSFSQIVAYLEKQKEQDKCPEYCVRSHCIGCPIYEKQKEQIPYIDFVIKPHNGDDNNPYDMRESEAQEYAIKRGFDIPFNDVVYVDERHMTQTIGNIIRWADEHPKEQKQWSEEDERMLSRCIKSVECSKQFADSESYKAAKDVEMNWLKSLPEKFNLEPKQEWNEEDEKTINDACCWIAEYAAYLMDKNYGKASMLMGLTDKLKSLHQQPKQD